jgi:chromosomal replication initiator protein
MVKQSLGRFLATPENQAALLAVKVLVDGFKAAQTWLEPPLLYLHGPPGTGKSHLVAGLVNELTGASSAVANVIFSAADVREDLPTAGRSRLERRECTPWLDQLGNSAVACDLLIVEDLQQLPLWAVERLIQVLDARMSREAATVLTANAAPRQLAHRGQNFPSRLASRIEAGLVVPVEPLSPASRVGILEGLAGQRGLIAPEEVLGWLAANLQGGVRQLEGALTQLETLAKMGRPLMDVAAAATHFRPQVDAGRPTLERIVAQVARLFKIKPALLKSPERSRGILWPRQISMYLARRLTALSLSQVGDYFGQRDHTTVLHACRKVQEALHADPSLSGTLGQLQAALA